MSWGTGPREASAPVPTRGSNASPGPRNPESAKSPAARGSRGSGWRLEAAAVRRGYFLAAAGLGGALALALAGAAAAAAATGAAAMGCCGAAGGAAPTAEPPLTL